MSPSSTQALIGTSIDNGRFELLQLVGKGGFGEIILARDVQEDQLVAIKCLSTKGLNAAQRAFQETEQYLYQRVSAHPNILTLQHVVKSHPGWTFLVLDWIEGGDLFEHITRGRFLATPSLISSVFLQILAAVEYCHNYGVAHRDIKPENVLCGEGGQVYLADFGLATGRERTREFGTGSSCFMSPECRDGLFQRPKTSYSSVSNDIWSLGILLLTLIVKTCPWAEAHLDDPAFAAFTLEPRLFLQHFPLSDEALSLLLAIFELNPSHRITLPELAGKVMSIKRWTVGPREENASVDSNRHRRSDSSKSSVDDGFPITPEDDEVDEGIPAAHTDKNALRTPHTPSPVFLALPTPFGAFHHPSSPNLHPRRLGFGVLFPTFATAVSTSSIASTLYESDDDEEEDEEDEEGEDSDESFFVDDITKANRDLLDEFFVTHPTPLVEDPSSLVVVAGRMLSLFQLEESGIPIGVDEEDEDQFELEDGHDGEETDRGDEERKTGRGGGGGKEGVEVEWGCWDRDLFGKVDKPFVRC